MSNLNKGKNNVNTVVKVGDATIMKRMGTGATADHKCFVFGYELDNTGAPYCGNGSDSDPFIL